MLDISPAYVDIYDTDLEPVAGLDKGRTQAYKQGKRYQDDDYSHDDGAPDHC